jgi:ankyrin repeat protein
MLVEPVKQPNYYLQEKNVLNTYAQLSEDDMETYIEEVKKGKDVTTIIDSSGATLLHIALQMNKTQVVEFLINHVLLFLKL